jgi:hypothetical protein
VSGLVLVDPASEFLKSSLTPEQWATYIKATKKLIEPGGLEAPDHERSLDLLHGTPRVRAIPVVVLTSDKRFDFGAGGAETWPAWRTAQDRLAKLLNAKHVSDTNSGHAIQMEQPQLVIDAIRDVVEAVRREKGQPQGNSGSDLNSESVDSLASRSLALAPRVLQSMSLDSRRLHSRAWLLTFNSR